jgi:hypothetical protein
MAKGQKRGNREVRKPKANKAVAKPAATFLNRGVPPLPTPTPKKKG